MTTFVEPDLTLRSFAALYGDWVASWESELAALATAAAARTLSAGEAARHRTVVMGEREIVTEQLRLLGGRSERLGTV
jgi:hypothetical protein